MMEDSLRQTIAMGGGSLAILWGRPIALALIGAGFLAVAITLYVRFRWGTRQVYLS